MYRAIILDLGKVLVNFDFRRGYAALEKLCPYEAAEIPRRIRGTGLVERFETGLVDAHDFVAQLSHILSAELNYGEFAHLWGSIFAEALIPDEMVEGLAKRYRLVMLSNTNSLHFETIRANYPVVRHFHALVLSYEVKAMKPSPEIYRAAVEAAGCEPQECFYTDDIAEYVEGARRIGIDAVQFRSVAQLEGEMRARGITWEIQ